MNRAARIPTFSLRRHQKGPDSSRWKLNDRIRFSPCLTGFASLIIGPIVRRLAPRNVSTYGSAAGNPFRETLVGFEPSQGQCVLTAANGHERPRPFCLRRTRRCWRGYAEPAAWDTDGVSVQSAPFVAASAIQLFPPAQLVGLHCSLGFAAASGGSASKQRTAFPPAGLGLPGSLSQPAARKHHRRNRSLSACV